MAIVTWTSRITKLNDISDKYPEQLLNPCLRHNIRPKLFEVYTGAKRKFHSVVAECGNDICACFSHSAEEVIIKWNACNPIETKCKLCGTVIIVGHEYCVDCFGKQMFK